jgi:hypothetical protein
LKPAAAPAKTAAGGEGRGDSVKTEKTLSEGQRAYEAKRAAKANMSLDKWLASKQRARKKAAEPPKPPKKPGLFARIMERAQKPL